MSDNELIRRLQSDPGSVILAGTFLLALIYGVLSIWLRASGKARRNAGLQALARKMGLGYEASTESLGIKMLKQFLLFQEYEKDPQGRIENVMRGSVLGTDITVFDIIYVRQDGDRGRPEARTVALFVLAEEILPLFALKPRTHGVVRDVLGPEVTKNYVVRSETDDEIRRYMGDRARKFLAENPGWFIEGYNHWLIVHRPLADVSAKKMPSFIEGTKEVLKNLLTVRKFFGDDLDMQAGGPPTIPSV